MYYNRIIHLCQPTLRNLVDLNGNIGYCIGDEEGCLRPGGTVMNEK